MRDLTKKELNAIISYSPDSGISKDEFEKEIKDILSEFPQDWMMQMIHLIRYNHFLKKRIETRLTSTRS